MQSLKLKALVCNLYALSEKERMELITCILNTLDEDDKMYAIIKNISKEEMHKYVCAISMIDAGILILP